MLAILLVHRQKAVLGWAGAMCRAWGWHGSPEEAEGCWWPELGSAITHHLGPEHPACSSDRAGCAAMPLRLSLLPPLPSLTTSEGALSSSLIYIFFFFNRSHFVLVVGFAGAGWKFLTNRQEDVR